MSPGKKHYETANRFTRAGGRGGIMNRKQRKKRLKIAQWRNQTYEQWFKKNARLVRFWAERGGTMRKEGVHDEV